MVSVISHTLRSYFQKYFDENIFVLVVLPVFAQAVMLVCVRRETQQWPYDQTVRTGHQVVQVEDYILYKDGGVNKNIY